MDHQMGGASCTMEGWEDSYYFGGRPNGIYIPRFRNVTEKHPDFLRGYGYQGRADRLGWQAGGSQPGFGAEFKKSLTQPGPWTFGLSGFGETLPDPNNRVTLNKEKTDKFGLPVLHIDAKYGENDLRMRKDYKDTAAEMLDAIGGKNIYKYDGFAVPGSAIHEMGTARMGRDAKTSVLNRWNQSHDISNLFITDGSFMTSAGCQNRT